MMETLSSEQEKQVKKLKRKLERWREVIVPMYSILVWEKNWYPGFIFGVISFVYMLIWVVNPSVLMIFSFIGIIITISDFIIPILMTNINFGGRWQGYKEKLFEDICKNMVCCYNWMLYLLFSFFNARDTKPKMFYSITLMSLSFLTWIGATVDNILLCYIITLFLALLPGLRRKELPRQYLHGAFSFLNATKTEKKEL